MIDQKALIDINKRLKEIGDKLEKVSKEVKNVFVQTLTSGAHLVRNTIILEMQKDNKTGHKYKKKSVIHQASAPGQYPAVDSGELLTSIFFDVVESKLQVEIGNLIGAPYGEFLEFGTSKMEPRPWLEPSVELHEDKIMKDMGEKSFEVIKKSFEGIH